MDILYSSDENYVKFAMVSIASLLENNQLAENITIYFIADELSEASKLQLESIVLLFNRKIEFIDAKNIDISFIRKTDFSPAGYYRLMIAEMIHSDKILYIDCDTVILGTLEELWSIDLEENLVAGVKDTVEDFMAVGVGLSNNSGYINSGVMLYNLKKMREINFTNQVICCFEKFAGYVPHHDQGVVNCLANGKIVYVSPKYNMMSQYLIFSQKQLGELFNIKELYKEDIVAEAKTAPIIVHFLNKFYGRPWEEGCENPYLPYFFELTNRYSIEINLIKKANNKRNRRIAFRKKAYKILPYKLYLLMEKILYIKRKKQFYKLYKKVY